MQSINETYTLSNGMKIPCMGFGTYKTGAGDGNIHTLAIKMGYRFFDTASLYNTERSLGAGIKESGIKREDLFIQSKLWHDERGYEETREALKRSLKRLGLDYLDMYLIHWPKSSVEEEGWEEKNLETWRAMADLQRQGLIRGMGVSNFLAHHLKSLIDGSGVKPLVDQLELHVGYSQQYVLDYCRDQGILAQAWSPLGRGDIVEDAFIGRIAAKYGKSVPIVCLRYLLDKGILPIVKASTEEHMLQNMEALGWELSFEDRSALESYPYSTWKGEHPDLTPPQKASDPDQ